MDQLRHGLQVVDDPERQRYDIFVDGQLAGFAAYQKTDQLVVLAHTEIDGRFQGQGLGGELVRRTLDDIRSQELLVLPTCPFVQQWMTGHPEYHDLDYRRRDSRGTD